LFSPLLYISGFNQTHLWRRSRHDWLFVYILANGTTSFIQPLTYTIVQGHQNNKTRDIHYKRHNIVIYIQFLTTLKTKNWITLTSIKTRGEIRCPIANTRVKHSKKAKLNIMHMTVNFWGFFFRTGKIFFGLTRSSCLSVRMTDNFSASFGKSVTLQVIFVLQSFNMLI
jgi:hypothetical protein